MNTEEIGSILMEIGFDKKEKQGECYYEFYQEYPQNVHGSNLWVNFDFENIKNPFIYFNCHNFHTEVRIKEITSKEKLLEHLDQIVLNSRDSWIYSDRTYFSWSTSADDQRKKYFEKRMLMETKPCKEVIENIKDFGLDHFETTLDTEHNGKKIGNMNWNELAEALVKTKTYQS